jgi:hypothetical protein
MLRKMLVVGLAAGVVAGALVMPAQAKKKKPKPPPPVATTMFMHGPSPIGELDGAQWLADGSSPESPMTLDGVAPTGGQSKSQAYFSPALNDQCTGLPAAFPTFTGKLIGTIVGDAKLTLHFMSAPATIKARIWADIGAFTMCNDDYVEPVAEVDVEIPAGQSKVEVVFPGLNLPATASIMIEVLAPSGTDWGAQVGRLLYDSTTTDSKIEFGCIPPSGATSCLPS